jgi:antitoxin component YwqK of YwqJK toxin-antitoxin module
MNIQHFVHSLLFFAFLLQTACENSIPKTYERVEKYENGQVSRRSNIVNGLKEGKMTDYYNDGKLMAERYFEKGQQQGRTVIYYPSGQIKEVQYFEKGKKQGGDTLWYEDGKIQFVTTLKDDKKHGYLRKLGTAGELIYEAKYDMDTLVEVKGQAINRNTSAAKPSQVLRKQE